jgi:hypothetical protein
MWATWDGIIAGKIFQTFVTGGEFPALSVLNNCFARLASFIRNSTTIKIVPNTGGKRE